MFRPAGQEPVLYPSSCPSSPHGGSRVVLGLMTASQLCSESAPLSCGDGTEFPPKRRRGCFRISHHQSSPIFFRALTDVRIPCFSKDPEKSSKPKPQAAVHDKSSFSQSSPAHAGREDGAAAFHSSVPRHFFSSSHVP